MYVTHVVCLTWMFTRTCFALFTLFYFVEIFCLYLHFFVISDWQKLKKTVKKLLKLVLK